MSEIELKRNVIKTGSEKGVILRFILASLVGVFMFFVPVTINGASSIMIDHIVSWIRTSVPSVVPYYALLVMAIGAIYPFYTKKMEYIYRRYLFFCFKSSWRRFWCIILFESRASLVLCTRCRAVFI